MKNSAYAWVSLKAPPQGRLKNGFQGTRLSCGETPANAIAFCWATSRLSEAWQFGQRSAIDLEAGISTIRPRLFSPVIAITAAAQAGVLAHQTAIAATSLTQRSSTQRPDASAELIGLAPTYEYVLIPPANPIGSLCAYRPTPGM